MDWLFLIVISFTVLTSHCQRHYVRQYVVRVSVVVAAQAMTAYGEVEKQLQSFLNSARDGASGQVRVLVVYSRAYILSPPPPLPARYTLNRRLGRLRRRDKVLAPVGIRTVISQTCEP